MGKKPPPPSGKKSTLSNIAFCIVVCVGIAIVGKALAEDDPDVKRVPPSVPTDVGTLKP